MDTKPLNDPFSKMENQISVDKESFENFASLAEEDTAKLNLGIGKAKNHNDFIVNTACEIKKAMSTIESAHNNILIFLQQ